MQNVSILNSPYALQDRGGMPFNSTSKLTDIWQSKSAFCNEFGGASEAGEVCFDGGPVVLNQTGKDMVGNCSRVRIRSTIGN